ncbi:MAG: adenylate/guanylate cyclase domain-containing protein [Hyphomicrobiales bacterium]
MAKKASTRRLTASLVADVANYSRLMGVDEARTHRLLKAQKSEVIGATIEERGGKLVHSAGDGLLVEFASVVDAVQCAINIQRRLAVRNAKAPENERLSWRIGVNYGDVIAEDDDIFGESVNVAARLQALSQPGGICISGRVFSEVKSKVDAAFESIGEQWLKNISEPVHVYRSSLGLDPSQVLGATGTGSGPNVVLDRPSLVVLPFSNLTADQGNQYLVDGLTEDLIIDLSMSPEFFVIARTSAFAFRDNKEALNKVASELGVSYVVVGSLQQDEKSFRVSAQLIEAETGIQLWVGRYNRQDAGLLEVRDEITHSIAATLMTTSGEIAKAELKKQAEKPPENFNVYDHFLKARELFHHSILPPWAEGKKKSKQAREMFTKAIGMSDPPYWPLYAALAWQYAIEFDWDYSEDPQESAELAFENAAIAVKNAPESHQAHWIMGWAFLFARRDYDRARFHYEKARELNVGDSRLLAEMSQLLIYTGDYELAINHLRQAIRLNPFHEQWYDEFLAWAYEENGQPKLATEILSKFTELEGIWSHCVLARAYAQCGEERKVASQFDIIQKLALEQTGKEFSMDYVRNWVALKEPYQNEKRAKRVVDIMENAFSEIEMTPAQSEAGAQMELQKR